MCVLVISSLFCFKFSRPDILVNESSLRGSAGSLCSVLMHCTNLVCHEATIVINFCPLLQRGLCAISTALPCPDRSPSSPLTHRPALPLPRSQQTTPPTPCLQGNKPRIIYSSPFPLVPSVFISFSLSSNPHPPPPKSFFYRCRYRARVEKVESPAKVHVFYIDYGNVSTSVAVKGTTVLNVSAHH